MNNFDKNIQDYGNSIKTMKNFVEAVRKNPGMHIGGTGNVAFVNMFREIFSNSIDELVKKKSPCDWIKVIFDQRQYLVTIEDNGRGIPFEMIEDIFTKEYTSSNYEKEKYEYSSGVHGIGSKITCALSELFVVKSHIFGKCKIAEFHEGEFKSIVDSEKPDRHQGTTISFIPYKKERDRLTTTPSDIRDLICKILLLTPLNSKIEYIGINADGVIEYNDKFVNANGLIDERKRVNEHAFIDDISFGMDNGEIKIDCCINASSPENLPEVSSFCNLTPTRDGVHKDGFYNGVVKFFRNYMNKVYLKNNSKLTVNSTDIKSVICGAIHICLLKPSFMGQAKDLLGDDVDGKINITQFVSDFIETSLKDWSNNNTKDLNKVCKVLKAVCESRVKSENTVKDIKKNFTSSALNQYPVKYKRALHKKNLELFIVEGDSALGSCVNSRDPSYQAIFPIKGKIVNALTTPIDKVLSNSEVASIISIIGGGYGKNFNLEAVNFDKIIFLTDSDIDGSHISTLLLNLFAVYMPQLIEDGRVYKALPPLYGISNKNKMKYFLDKMEEINYVKDLFIKNNVVSIKNKTLDNQKLLDILYINSDYITEIEKLANNYAAPPIIIEKLLVDSLHKIDIKKTYKYLKDKYYRFLKLDEDNGVKILSGIADNSTIELIIADNFFRDSSIVLDILLKNMDYNFEINGEEATLYQLMKRFKSYEPPGLIRFKGLGEMEPYQIKETALDKNSRTLIRYNPNDFKNEINLMRQFSADRYKLIEMAKVDRLEL